eukprot:GHVR01035192.1.p1 GENE.GHVR01035192.1~~GHVR01035192.1.p1  ORF type:complete len:311 (-),score=70.10 GHVR01035192.1:87-1019(-)
MSSILGGILHPLLNKYFSKFELNESLLGGPSFAPKIYLRDVHLQQSVIDLLDLPFILEYGVIDKVCIDTTWSTLFGTTYEVSHLSPINASVEGVKVIVSLKWPTTWDLNKIKDLLLITKSKWIDAWNTLHSAFVKNKNNNSLKDQVKLKVMATLKCIITNIDFRIRDYRLPGGAFDLCVLCDSIEVSPPCSNDTRLSSLDLSMIEHMHLICKIVKLFNLRIVFRADRQRNVIKKSVEVPVLPDDPDWVKNLVGMDVTTDPTDMEIVWKKFEPTSLSACDCSSQSARTMDILWKKSSSIQTHTHTHTHNVK